MPVTPLVTRTVTSPVGPLRLVATDSALVGVWFPDHKGASVVDAVPVDRHPVLDLAAAQLAEFFAGTRRTFTVPLSAEGTPFQRAVWAELARIPFGERRTYAQLAVAVGRPNAVRAVGSANGANPVSLFVPCHRVVASDGSISGYAGGPENKRWLLEWEAGQSTERLRFDNPPLPASA